MGVRLIRIGRVRAITNLSIVKNFQTLSSYRAGSYMVVLCTTYLRL
jgi:hypothetical protein